MKPTKSDLIEALIRRLFPLVVIVVWVFVLMGGFVVDAILSKDLGKLGISLFFLALYVLWLADFGRRLVKLNFFALPDRDIKRTRLNTERK